MSERIETPPSGCGGETSARSKNGSEAGLSSTPDGWTLRESIQRLGFWSSVLIPATYLPVLYGLDGTVRGLVLGGLLGVNVACLVVGHDHTRRE